MYPQNYKSANHRRGHLKSSIVIMSSFTSRDLGDSLGQDTGTNTLTADDVISMCAFPMHTTAICCSPPDSKMYSPDDRHDVRHSLQFSRLRSWLRSLNGGLWPFDYPLCGNYIAFVYKIYWPRGLKLWCFIVFSMWHFTKAIVPRYTKIVCL